MKKHAKTLKILMFLAAAVLFSLLCWLLWAFVPRSSVRYSLLAVTGGIFVLAGLWIWFQQRQIFHFADEICDTLDALISGRQPEVERPYEDSVTAKVQGKLLQYYDIMNEGKVQSQRDKQTIQELVSDISHQVKTPIANIQMFTGILQQHQLTEEKRAEFLETMASQINKLDFLMQSLIKMSRLETGTFVLHMEEAPLDKTIAQAISSVWAKADRKNIQLSVDCAPSVTVQHDPKWTAEALGNILDNGVKYTPEGGSISVSVRPWQFYEHIPAAQEMIDAYTKTVDTSLPVTSRKTMAEQYEAETRASAVMGNTISVIIALVGVLNFINSMVTAIVSRKKEFAMIQSVGMTKRQLRKMLICEGLDYAAITLIVSYLVSTLAVGIGVRAITANEFSTFHFTLMPLMICTPILLAFAVLIPFLCFKNLEKQSIVERLRTE